MEAARRRVLDEFPIPIAYTYSLIFDESRSPSVRRWALCYCGYQVLRCMALPLVGQYLRADLGGIDFARDKAAGKAIRSLNTNIAGIRAPFYSNWIDLIPTFRDRLPALGLRPIVPDLDGALAALKGTEVHEFGMPGEPATAPLRALLALRNATAHGATPDESDAARHLDTYLPVLHQILDAFDPLAACRTAWSDLSGSTRALLANPLYLHLFMQTFDGLPAEPVTTVPALFRRFVDQAVREYPGLLRSIEAVIGHIRSNPARPSADLDDDDVNAIRETWAKTLTVEERSIRPHPVEDLAHASWVHKRVREEGGGYRFLFQAVAEYLIYLDLLRARPRDEDELAYWTRRVVPGPVFPEYAGAFTFLLRDWADRDALGHAARIVETSPAWFDEVLKGFLVEQARIGHAPGQASSRAEAAARMLEQVGSERTASTLFAAGYELESTELAPEAIGYYRASLKIREALWAANPGHVGIKAGYASSLCDFGRYGEASRLINEVLSLLPHHPYANALRRYIETRLASGESSPS